MNLIRVKKKRFDSGTDWENKNRLSEYQASITQVRNKMSALNTFFKSHVFGGFVLKPMKNAHKTHALIRQ